MTNVIARAERWAQSATPMPGDVRIPDFLPPFLLRSGPYDLAWWQWLGLPILAVLSLTLGRGLGTLTQNVLLRVFRRTRIKFDERWTERMGSGLTVLWGILLFRAALPWLELHQRGRLAVVEVVTAVGVITIFWALWRTVDVVVELTTERPWGAHASTRSMLIVGGNLLKTAVVIIGAVATAAAFGYPVATVLAGLGIGGIAFAFGAQKTIENVFGSLALAVDQPLRVGDTVKVDGMEGQVERIGARSTRFRTPERTLVTIPNGRLADSRIESLSMRDRLRMSTMVMLALDTDAAKVRTVIEGIETLLRHHPLVWKEIAVARLSNLSAVAIEIEVMCWFETADFERFRTARQEVLLGIVTVAENAGARLGPPPATAPAPAAPGVSQPAGR